MGDIKSKPLIIVKGILFLVNILITGGALFAPNPDWITTALILLLIWASVVSRDPCCARVTGDA